MRLTAAERRTEVLQAAVQAFAASGYAATTTAEIARGVPLEPVDPDIDPASPAGPCACTAGAPSYGRLGRS
ncbi:hypothetical protein AB0H36_06300 [Kribbella sp. NPDC050820]|uniref:hypothetical protein n=1 Tax=Kribbella sp. NPDC050820 TaxID=3155408 RepID=UPI0033F79984